MHLAPATSGGSRGVSVRSAIFWGLLALLVLVALLHLAEIRHVVRLLRGIAWWRLLLALAAQGLTYGATVLGLQRLLRVLGHPLAFRRVWGPGIALVLGGQTVPTAGVGGLVLWTIGLQREGVPREAAIVSGVLYSVLDYAAFLALLVAGVAILLAEHSVPHLLLVTLTATSVMLVAVVVAGVLLARREERLLAVAAKAVDGINWVLARLHLALVREEAVASRVDAVYGAWREGGTGHYRVWLPGVWVLASRGLDVVTLQVLFAAVGAPLGVGAITLGYVYANFASFVSLLPTGLGVLDASLAALYASLGAPLAAAVVVTLLFRALAYWLPIPYAIYLYRRLVHQAPLAPGQAAPGEPREEAA